MSTAAVLAFVEDQGPAPEPTFTEDVAPIVFARCASCHRPDATGPAPPPRSRS